MLCLQLTPKWVSKRKRVCRMLGGYGKRACNKKRKEKANLVRH